MSATAHAHASQDNIREFWARPARKRQARAMIVGGICIGWMAGALYLTISARAWTFSALAGAMALGAIAKTISIYRSF